MDYRRSPRYPAVSLSVAINGAHLLWTKDKRTAARGEALARALGYKGHSGPARTLIGAMRQYGLLEKQGRGLGPSDRAILIVRSTEGSREQLTAIRKAALAPDLFRDLYATHRGEPAETIKSYLTLRRGFTELGAALAVSAYRDTLSLAKLPVSGPVFIDAPETIDGPETPQAPVANGRSDSLLTQTLMVSIPRNFKVDVNVHGDRIEKGDLARIKNQLDRWIEGLEDALK